MQEKSCRQLLPFEYSIHKLDRHTDYIDTNRRNGFSAMSPNNNNIRCGGLQLIKKRKQMKLKPL